MESVDCIASAKSVFQVFFAWLVIPFAIGFAQITFVETDGPDGQLPAPTIGEESYFMSTGQVLGNKWIAFIDAGTLKPQEGLAPPFTHSLQATGLKTKYCVVVDLVREQCAWFEAKDAGDMFGRLSDMSVISDHLVSVRRTVRKRENEEWIDQFNLEFTSGMMSIRSSPAVVTRSGFEWTQRMKLARIDFDQNGTVSIASNDRRTSISLTGTVRPHAGIRSLNEPATYLIPGNSYSSLYLVENQRNKSPKLVHWEFHSNTNKSSPAKKLTIDIEAECAKQACQYLLPAIESRHPIDSTWIVAHFADETKYALKLKDGKVTYVKSLVNLTKVNWHRGSPAGRFLALVCENDRSFNKREVIILDSQDNIVHKFGHCKQDGFYFSGVTDSGRIVFDKPNKGLKVFELTGDGFSKCFEFQLFD